MFAKLVRRSAAIALVVLVLVVPSAAGAQPPDMQLETGPNNRTLRLGDIASANQIAVVFQDANKSHLRWSTDGGSTFTPRHVLRDGLRAKNPRVDACGNKVWVASEWQSDVNQKVGVDLFDTIADTTVRFPVSQGSKPDVACFGGVVAVTWWNADHAFVRFYNGPCIHSCVAAGRDLGPADFDSPARIAATDDGFAVSWLTASLNVQHFDVTTNGPGAPTVVDGPVVSMLAGQDVRQPVVAGDGSRVIVAYSKLGQTHMRISENYGATYGPRIIVSTFCRDCPEGGSQPMGIDARNGDILVEVLAAGGAPADYEATGFLTHNDGATWSKTPSNRGQKFGVLRGNTLAEAWDDSLARGFPYPSRPQVIMFHIRNI
ncbi:MAG TPA: hypothetical protein VEX62_04440 [Candidatus Limnocylindrales bacterium]|nr:hypothetical protein [Candidatus Limnocylindrales bacterium]